MPPTVNPRSQGTQEAQRLIAGASAPQAPPPRPGYAWGLLTARMKERVLPPGGIVKTKLIWSRCGSSPLCGEDGCKQAGQCYAGGRSLLICGRCCDTEQVFVGLRIHGSLDAPVSISCERCGGEGLEVQGYNETTKDPRIPGRIYYSPQTHQLEEWQ